METCLRRDMDSRKMTESVFGGAFAQVRSSSFHLARTPGRRGGSQLFAHLPLLDERRRLLKEDHQARSNLTAGVWGEYALALGSGTRNDSGGTSCVRQVAFSLPTRTQ